MISNLVNLSFKNKNIAIVGFGVTGKVCAKYLMQKNAFVTVFDKQIHASSQNQSDFLQVQFKSLAADTSLLEFDIVVVSPGVNLRQPFLQEFIAHNKPVIGDIEIFALALKAQKCPPKVIGITGSNGKSTVVDMLFKVLKTNAYKVALGGNFGNSALEFLEQDLDFIVLELSSFQLESTYNLNLEIACILNVTPDHMDRHGNMAEYISIKQKIYQHAEALIFNRDDNATKPQPTQLNQSVEQPCTVEHTKQNQFSFGLTQCHDQRAFWQSSKGVYLGKQLIIDNDKLANSSRHQLMNVQVVLACALILGIELNKVTPVIYDYQGLAHRFQTVFSNERCTWINDSKATNPGACIAALECIDRSTKHTILIAGGDAKGADLTVLKQTLKQTVDCLVLIGKDAQLFSHVIDATVHAKNMHDAVQLAQNAAADLLRHSAKQVVILLSPACASIDMFSNYQERGDVFSASVLSQVAA